MGGIAELGIAGAGLKSGSEESVMPLRDHFRPPVSKKASWQGFHGLWPGIIVQQLFRTLPEGFVAEPRVQLGTYFEIDIGAFSDEFADGEREPVVSSSGGVATAMQAPPAPSLTLETDITEQYAYEVLVFDFEYERRLVAAIEFVSPANKDRPDDRQMFVMKCGTLLQEGICVSIVDLVTIRQFNLYAELLALMKRADPAFATNAAPAYAATCRKRAVDHRTLLDLWSYPINLGEPLPTIPIWLSESQSVMLDLESSYEETCRLLRIA